MTDQRSSNSNFFLFLVLSALMAIGWVWLGQAIWPQKPQDQASRNQELMENELPVNGESFRPGAKAEEPIKNNTGSKVGSIEVPLPKAADSEPMRWHNSAGTELVRMGLADESGHMEIWLDPVGAVVRQVRLRHFQGADSNGVATDGKLDIIPLSPVPSCPDYQPGAFGLLHYPKMARDQPTDELLRRTWTVKSSTFQAPGGKEGEEVTFQTEIDGVSVSKRFRLTPGDYHLGLSVVTTSADGLDHSFRYQLVGPRGLPIEGDWYVQVFRNAVYGIEHDGGGFEREVHDMRAMATAMGAPVAPLGGDPGNFKRLRYAGIQTQYFASVIAIRNPDSVPVRRCQATVENAIHRGTFIGVDFARSRLIIGDSLGKKQEFRLSSALAKRLLTPVNQAPFIDGKQLPNRDVSVLYCWEPEAGADSFQFVALDIKDSTQTNNLYASDATVRLSMEAQEIKPGKMVEHDFVLYTGPAKPSLMSLFREESKVDQAIIDDYSNNLRLYTLVDYPSAFGSWFLCGGFSKVVIFFTNLLHGVLGFMHLVIPSYALCIVLLTVMVRLSMFPISRKQALSNLKMQALAPQLKEIQKKHAGDAQALGRAQMEMYKRHGINPAAGCLPLLLQMPIFMGLYWAFQESIEMRLHSMELTWVKNLAAPDMLFFWGDNIPYLSRPTDYGSIIFLGPYLNLLPLFAMGLMVVQQKMFMPPPTNDEMKSQQNIMMFMSVAMSVVFYRVPAGLCLYFIASSLWGVTERQLLKPRGQVDLLLIAVAGPPKPKSWLAQWFNGLRQKIEQQGNPRRAKPKR